jgi:hypothetical protein
MERFFLHDVGAIRGGDDVAVRITLMRVKRRSPRFAFRHVAIEPVAPRHAVRFEGASR